MRTLTNELTRQIGNQVVLKGWVHARRDHGKLIFLDLRDRAGLAQIVVLPKSKAYAVAETLRSEFVVEIIGQVNERPANMVNPDIPSGTVEVLAENISILSVAKTPPFEIEDTAHINEETRLKYRYIDLRTHRLQKNIRLRSKFVQKVRSFLFDQDFTEIETPLLTKSTAEGSRDFIVPSRLQPGKFYALPQSPQQYKQLLMVAGFDRYFQIARAIRDEDLRADRGFEHTQIDIEMSFVEREDILKIMEAMITQTVEGLGFTIKEKPFPRISYTEAMKKFGADKFDLRTEEDKKNGILAYAWVIDFPFFEKTDTGGWTFTHNPFSQPLPEYLEDHLVGNNIEHILTSQYDLVCNGFEAGGGSIRAHQSEVLQATYRNMGYSEQETLDSVGHMLEAFSYGAPPHGGIAFGVERNLMNLTGENYLREVQAFPMTSGGRTAVMDAPSTIADEQLKEVGIALRKPAK
ncbi:MAG: aspartate--tRNA ligase [Patescibacteria group bacterium]